MKSEITSKNGILKETLIYSIGSFGSKIFSFLLIPFYTFFLTKKEIGDFDLLFTSITLFVPLVSLQMSDAVYRWLIEDHETDKRKTIIISNGFFGLIIAFTIFLLFFVFYTWKYPFRYSLYFIILLFLNSLLPILQNILRGLGDTKKFAFNGVITSILLVIFNIIFIYVLKLKLDGILLANIIAFSIAIILIYFQLRLYKYIKLSFFDRLVLIDFCKYTLPLIPNLMSWWLISSASKFIILHYLGTEANGIYAITSRFPSILIIINSVLILPIQDSFLKKDSKNSELNFIIKHFIKLEFSLILMLIVTAPFYMRIIVSKEFYESWPYMPFLYLGVGFNTLGALFGLIYQKNKATKQITVSTMIGASISIIFSILFVRQYQLMAISVAFLLGYIIMTMIRFIDLKKYFNDSRILIELLMFLSLCMIAFFISYYSTNVVRLFIILISGIISIYLNMNFIRILLKKININI